ncbi:MAG: PhnD/SsuA/transferrin family substrate-binding protein [Pseudomonadota bacterium]
MKPVAGLAMYARPELTDEFSLFWRAIRERLIRDGIGAPEVLTQDGYGSAFWRAPNLVLGQTCGYPYRTELKDAVSFVGTPDYGLEGCPPGYYRSVIVAREASPLRSRDDLDGVDLAYNDDQSQSGFHGPLAWARQLGLKLNPTLATGAHRQSAQAVAEGRAEIAAIDAVTWRFMERHDAQPNALRVIAQTPPVPGLPLICAKGVDPLRVARAVSGAIEAIGPDIRTALSITGLSPLCAEDYTASAFDPIVKSAPSRVWSG